MSGSRASERAGTEASLEAVLDCVALPVWVVDSDGLVVFANPAAVAVLGFDDPAELRGRHGHDTVHYLYPDGSPYPAEECPVLEPGRSGTTVHRDEDWFIRRDGTMFPVSFTAVPIELPTGRGVVTTFVDMTEQRAAERAARERDVAEARAVELAAARRRIIEAADAARERVTRDLHDGAQQQFVSAVLNLQVAEKKAAAEDAEAAAELRRLALEYVREGITALRDLSAGLHPGILTDRGLAAAVRALASRLPLPVEVDEALQERPPAPVEASVYFFVSEALANVVKHARAGQARVTMAVTDGRLRVEVADDGIGGAVEMAGSGLVGLRDRVEAVGGVFSVDSAPGRGTRVRAVIPLAASTAAGAP
jgi:PAS domain S-box-containing protein